MNKKHTCFYRSCLQSYSSECGDGCRMQAPPFHLVCTRRNERERLPKIRRCSRLNPANVVIAFENYPEANKFRLVRCRETGTADDTYTLVKLAPGSSSDKLPTAFMPCAADETVFGRPTYFNSQLASLKIMRKIKKKIRNAMWNF